MGGNPPEVDGDTALVPSEGKEDALPAAQPCLEDDLAGQALELLYPDPGVPDAVGQELELLQKALFLRSLAAENMVFQNVVEQKNVTGSHSLICHR